MTDDHPVTPAALGQQPKTILTPASVLAATVEREKSREEVDQELILALESTVLRVDAADGAWDKAAAEIRKLAATRAESRLGDV